MRIEVAEGTFPEVLGCRGRNPMEARRCHGPTENPNSKSPDDGERQPMARDSDDQRVIPFLRHEKKGDPGVEPGASRPESQIP
jgi:hypothetical protein